MLQLRSFLDSALHGSERLSCPAALPGVRRTGGLVGPTASVDVLENACLALMAAFLKLWSSGSALVVLLD